MNLSMNISHNWETEMLAHMLIGNPIFNFILSHFYPPYSQIGQGAYMVFCTSILFS